MKIKGVIFDLDGTLVHTIEDIAAAANMMFSRNGMPEHGVDYYLQWIGSGAIRFIEQAMGKEVSTQELMQYVAEFKEIYSNNLHVRSRVYDGIPEVLDMLRDRGIKMAVLSNKPHLMTRQVTRHYLSHWPIDPVFGQREEVPRKPDPAAAFEIASILQIAPDHFIFVGDSENDVLTAIACGMMPVGVSWGYGDPDVSLAEGRSWYIDKPTDLLDIIAASNANE
jgi:phosphoglycolate phosphatase